MEYIERETVMLQINAADFIRDDNYEAGATLLFQDDVVDRISSIPAADVRPVVRCKDCKFWFDAPAADGFNSCERDALIRHENFFCAAGEKREES